MKLAITGKGGVGKSTIAAIVSLLLANEGKVLAVDADPAANLAASLGVPEELEKQILPISKQIKLIEERTGAKVREYGQMFKLNPEVSDIAGEYAVVYRGVALLVLGAVESGGSGCACPENVLIRALVSDLVLYQNESLVMDMEAGIEHLGRATARGVDVMLVVVEPGRMAIDTAQKIFTMAGEIGIEKIKLIGNKIMEEEDKNFIRQSFPDKEILGFVPYCENIRKSDRNGRSVLEGLTEEQLLAFQGILAKLKEGVK